MNVQAIIFNPAWPLGPPICRYAMLPAMETHAAMLDYLRENSPGCPIVRIWECRDCKGWHAEARARDPAGNSSGTSRGMK